MSQEAIKALGSTVPMTQFDRDYWQRWHDANTPEWQQAKRLCQLTILANYPNCLPVNEVLQADQKRKAELGTKVRVKNDEMFRRGYEYDYLRKSWLPMSDMDRAGCLYTDAYPGDLTKIGIATWRCAPGTTIPKGIPDPDFSESGE
jgi:hypothetical protein